jgi:hypothetical protein
MNDEIDELLHALRQAMYEALACSGDVAEAMVRLEQEGHCPTLLVDVWLADQPRPAQNDETKFSRALVLTR